MTRKDFFHNFIFRTLREPEIYKFIFVGIGNAFVLLFLTIFLTEYLNLYYLHSSIISYEITIVIGFLFNDYWTFSKNKKTNSKFFRFLKYEIFYILGLSLNSGILFLLTDTLSISYFLSQNVSIVIVFLFNFSISKKITFKN